MAPKVTITGYEHLTEEQHEAARIGMDFYRKKRALIRAMEYLDCIDDAALIEAIASVVPARQPPKKEKRRRASASTPKGER